MGVVLIAFERESEQNAVEQLLTTRGHRVVRAANGLTALDAARREPPDLIVSDIVLPRMDGFALCRKWKQDERLQSVPFVFYTRRHDDPKYERFALELGAERFLARSVQPEVLLSVVDELVAHSTPRTGATAPLPVMDDAALKRAQAVEQEQGRQKARDQQARDQQAREQQVREQQIKEQQAREEQLRGQLAKEQQAREQQEKDHQAKLQAQAASLSRAHDEEVARARQAQEEAFGKLAALEAANERLAAGEARFRKVFEANPIPLWIADQATGGFIAVNDAALAMYGYARPEFLGLKSAALLAPAEGSSRAVDEITLHRRKDGHVLAVAQATQGIEFDGRDALLVSAVNLSARVDAEKELQETAAEQRAWFDAAADGLLLLDSAGKLLDANAAYCRWSGYDRNALKLMHLDDLVGQSTSNDTLRLNLGRSGAGERYETSHRRADGSSCDVEVSVGHSDAAPADRVLVIRDVSQRRREQRAQRATQQQLEFLVELTRQSERLDESAIVRQLLEQAQQVTDSALTFLITVDAKEKTSVLTAWRDDREGAILMPVADAQPLVRNAFADCIRNRHAVSNNDNNRSVHVEGLPEMQRYIAVPMTVADETIAVLGVANRETTYGEDDQRALAFLADYISRVLDTRRTHARTLRSLQRTDVALQGMIDTFVRMSELHDPYTAGSSRRLAALAVAIGREAGLDGERQHALRVAALLHDVGNIAVPASILSKPAPLTETELALMRTHVEAGCQLLADIDFGAPIADLVYQTHERFDGSGYPRGLKADEIMLEARILGIADTVEAMCSPRPYRPAAGMDAAINEINRGAGRLYDEQLVGACTRLIKERGFVLPE